MNKLRTGHSISDQFASYFLTFTVVGWVDLFSRKACRDVLIDSMTHCQQHKGLIVQAYVIMSSHMHVIWRAREDSGGLSGIVRDYKRYSSNHLLKWIMKSPEESRKDWMKLVFRYHARYASSNNQYAIWTKDNHPKILLHPRFISQKIDYIHRNPVVNGLVLNPEDYLYSSAGNYVQKEGCLMHVEVIDFGVQEGYVFL